jgi:hypothetical protein
MNSLAQLMVDQVYGEEYADVCHLLGIHKSLSIQDLDHFSNLSYSRLREIVVVLFDAHFLEHKQDQFQMNMDQIIQSINFPLYYQLILEQEGPQAAQVLLSFCELSTQSLNEITANL